MKKKHAVRKAVARRARAVPVEVLDSNQPAPKSVLRIVGHPICVIAERLHIASDGRIERRSLRYVIGGVMMVTGSSMAVGAHAFHLGHIGLTVIDLVAYAIHGCGAVPYITHVVRRLELEG